VAAGAIGMPSEDDVNAITLAVAFRQSFCRDKA
jgi:hypothetical protein